MRSLVIGILVLGCGSSSPGAIDGPPGGGDARDDSGLEDGPRGDAEMSDCPSGQWCMETSPVPGKLLYDAFAIPGGDVYVVGETGTILRRRGGDWQQMTSNTTEVLLGVWAASNSDIWVISANGTVLRSDGSTWSVVTGTGISSDIDAIWGSSSSDVWISGNQAVYHWNGASWSTQGFTGNYVALSGSGPNDVWTGGENVAQPVLRHYTTSWGTSTHGLGNTTIFSILAFAPNDVWAASAIPNKETVHWNGSTWTPHATMVGTIFQDMHGRPDDFWGVGSSRVGRWNGSTWTVTQPLGGAVSLYAVTGTGSSVWVVGASSLIATHRD